VIREEKLAERAQQLGEYFMEQLAEIPSPHVKEVRGKGLLIGVELKPQAGGARRFCEALQPGASSPRRRTITSSALRRRW
jgi:ornithine--oxo-acid transaminase